MAKWHHSLWTSLLFVHNDHCGRKTAFASTVVTGKRDSTVHILRHRRSRAFTLVRLHGQHINARLARGQQATSRIVSPILTKVKPEISLFKDLSEIELDQLFCSWLGEYMYFCSIITLAVQAINMSSSPITSVQKYIVFTSSTWQKLLSFWFLWGWLWWPVPTLWGKLENKMKMLNSKNLVFIHNYNYVTVLKLFCPFQPKYRRMMRKLWLVYQ